MSVESLVLDATPLITQPAATLLQLAATYYTTPGVKAELRSEFARQQLLVWDDKLQVRQPKQALVEKVTAFARATGDHLVLSLNDVHIIALAYELEVEKNGETNLRKPAAVEPARVKRQEVTEEAEEESGAEVDEDGFEVVKPRRRPATQRNWKPKLDSQTSEEKNKEVIKTKEDEAAKAEAKEAETHKELLASSESVTPGPVNESGDSVDALVESMAGSTLQEDYAEEDDDGDWITPDNLQEELHKDNSEAIEFNESQTVSVALATGDFACQNVAMRMGLKLMNTHLGRQIKRVRNYMYRCHACFTMVPIPKNGPRHFCPRCGGATLLRCAVSVDEATGQLTPHLKRNFKWNLRGNVYLLPSPLSRNSKKHYGNKGFQHNKENRHKSMRDPVLLREDQKEYVRAVEEDARARRQHEKMLQEWVGGGSADNVISPFSTPARLSGVKVGRGRNVNAARRKK